MPRSSLAHGRRLSRRTVLGILGTGALSLGGCLSAASRDEATPACLETGTVSLAAQGETFLVQTDDSTVETFTFTLSNETSCSVTVGRGTWQLRRLTGDEAEVVAQGDEAGIRTLRSGDSHTWSLSLHPRSTPETSATTYLTATLSEGQFAFVVAGSVSEEQQFTRSARFTLVKQTATS